MRHHVTQHASGTFLTFEQRLTLAPDWNRLVRAGYRVTVRQFAARHGLRSETWRREYHCGATGVAVPDPKDRRRRKHAEYDPFRAQSITADNGCEFLDPEKIKAIVGCDVYYTRAYASWEKGSVENCNRLVRRLYPKGTDFGKCTRADMRRLEDIINSIHRKQLGGKTAYEYDTAHARAA